MNTTAGELPSDELLSEVSNFLTPPGFPSPSGVGVPTQLRDAISQIITPTAQSLADAGALPFLSEVVTSFEQIPKLIDEVSFLLSTQKYKAVAFIIL